MGQEENIKSELEFYKDWQKQAILDVLKNHHKEVDMDSKNVKLWIKLRKDEKNNS